MAPDQRKKRFNSGSCDGKKQHPTKRKKPQDTPYTISLQSDARREHGYTNLAVPHTTFELKDLTGVLSYEVWHSHFSDSERSILSHYLPRGADPDKVVQELLSGDNFHFGNPFLKWGASLCSGKLHPGDVLHREQYIKAKEKMYLSELQKYHNHMIESLQRWKDTLDRCKDPQEETLPNIWMPRKGSEKRMNLCEMLYVNEDDDTTTPESSPQATSDKACCNNKVLHIPGDCHRRNVLSDSNVNKASDGLKVALKPKTEEKLQKRNVQLGDSAEYMSYIKPFEVCEEEERQKLRDYWFRLVTREFPAFYANWRERKSKAQELVKSMCQDLEEKLKLQEKDDENDNPHKLSSAELANNVDTAVSLSPGEQEDEKIEVFHTLTVGQMANQVGCGEIALSLENEEDEKTYYAHERQKYDGEEDEKMAATNFREQVSGMSDVIGKEFYPDVSLPGPGAVGEHNAVSVGGSFYHPAAVDEYGEAAEMIDLEAADPGTQSDLCFHDCFSDGKHMLSGLLPKRMGLDFDEAMAVGENGEILCDFRESNIQDHSLFGVLSECNAFCRSSSGLDQTLFSVLSECNAPTPAPAPAPAPATSSSIPMPYESMISPVSEQSSGVNTSLEWMF